MDVTETGSDSARLIHLAWDKGPVQGCCGHSKEPSRFHNRQAVFLSTGIPIGFSEASVSG
jgi:hypothetical protein